MRRLFCAGATTRAVVRNSAVSARTYAWLHGVVALTSFIALGGCSAPPGAVPVDDDDSDVPEYGGPASNGSGTPLPAQPGAPTGAAGSASTSGTGSTTPPPAPASNGSEQNGANGAPLTPSQPNTGNTGNSSGMNQGAAGSSMVPPVSGNQGAGGSSMGGNEDDGDDGDDGNTDPGTPPVTPPPVTPPPVTPPPVTPPPVTPPPVTPPPSAPDIACPAGATFCAGFENDALPNGAIYQGNPGLEFDDTVSHSGERSAVFEPVDGFNIRAVVTPIPGQAFWVRLFIQTSTTFGDNDHDSLFVASTANFQQDNNAENGPEFSEQGNQILINANDQLFNAAGAGFPSNGQGGPQLTPNVWHCVEAFYDGGSGNVQFFNDGQQIISAPGFSRLTYASFRFGYLQFPGHAPRVVWYDDVVVAANRVGCN
jgi:hypothetical protein